MGRAKALRKPCARPSALENAVYRIAAPLGAVPVGPVHIVAGDAILQRSLQNLHKQRPRRFIPLLVEGVHRPAVNIRIGLLVLEQRIGIAFVKVEQPFPASAQVGRKIFPERTWTVWKRK